MTSRMEFRNYRSSAQLVHCNIHRKRYNHFPEYFKFPSLQEIQAVGLTFVLTIVTYADKPTIKQTKNSSKMTGMEASSVKCARIFT